MKSRAVLLLLMLCGAAVADPVVRSSNGVMAAGVVDLASTGHGFSCAPSPVGGGTFPTLRSNSAGTVVWWYCPIPDGAWQVNWAAATAEQMSISNLLGQAEAVLKDADPRAAFATAVARNVSVPINAPSMMAVWQPFATEMVARVPPSRPAAAAPGSAAASAR